MASPVPVPAADIAAVYNVSGRFLELRAKGELPSSILPPFFKREEFFGGLRFSLRSFSAGYGKPVQKPFESSFKLPIQLPVDHFNNKSVAVETSLGTWTIPIHYDGLLGSAQGDSNDDAIFGDVLTPINEFLTSDHDLSIRAQIPKTTGNARTSIDPEFNEDYLKLVTSGIFDGAITWTFKWNKIPTGEGENPQFINVTTSIWNGEVGPIARTSRIVQPYIVHFVVLET
ncbi:hypothetical protein G7Z17_g5364 [Cylindrodendrum hubeiense]|uniref:Uncharacterized protein n=1 Tax=Cylindrodendrum hubeiense TaxID=595255 RepID=A0A9P5HH86_9HYPO|nr:hypothetical protein G7Z17_g5364 [Cylindrodendrum hubeiense]